MLQLLASVITAVVLHVFFPVNNALSTGHFQFRCPRGHRLTTVHSVYSPAFFQGERFYDFSCEPLANKPIPETCKPSNQLEGKQDDLFLQCRDNSYVAGVMRAEGQRVSSWQLICCNAHAVYVDEARCALTHMINDFGQNMRFKVVPGYLVRTWQSLYDEEKKDRRWWYEICPYNVSDIYEPDSLQSILSRYDRRQPYEVTTSSTSPPSTSTIVATSTSTLPSTTAHVPTPGHNSNFQVDEREMHFQKMLSALNGSPKKSKSEHYPPIAFALADAPRVLANDLDINSLRKVFPSLTEHEFVPSLAAASPTKSDLPSPVWDLQEKPLTRPPNDRQLPPRPGMPPQINQAPSINRNLPPRPGLRQPFFRQNEGLLPSMSFGKPQKTYTKQPKPGGGFNVVDMISNMQDGLKFAFQDDNGRFSLKDGIASTVEYLGLCGRKK